MNKKEFVEKYQEFFNDENINALVVEIDIPDCKDPEYIVISNKNQPAKISYYIKNYDNKMRLKNNPRIQIVGIQPFDMKWITGDSNEND